MPRADDPPSFDLGFNSTRCRTNPLGAKGCGEAGAGPGTASQIWWAMRR
jgi:carbon-monoxide dehydrogenase large subunit